MKLLVSAEDICGYSKKNAICKNGTLTRKNN